MKRKNYNIRPMGRDDIDRVVELWEEYIAFHEAIDSFFCRQPGASDALRRHLDRGLESPGQLALVAADSDEEASPVGFCLTDIYNELLIGSGPMAKITDLYVAEPHRRCHVGKRLVQSACHMLHEKHICRIEVGPILVANETARAFWVDLGFLPFQERFVADRGSRS